MQAFYSLPRPTTQISNEDVQSSSLMLKSNISKSLDHIYLLVLILRGRKIIYLQKIMHNIAKASSGINVDIDGMKGSIINQLW